MAITIFDFIDKYPSFEDNSYIKKYFNSLSRWGYFFVCMFQDAYDYNQSWETPDGLFWSVFIVSSNEYYRSVMGEKAKHLPNYLCTLRGCDDYSYSKNCDTLLEAIGVYTAISKLEPLDIEDLIKLGFYFSN